MQKRAVCLQVRCHLLRPDQVSRGGARGHGGAGRGGGGAGAARALEPGRGSHLLLVTAALLRLCAAAGASLHNSLSSSGWRVACSVPCVPWSGLPHSLTRQPPATGLGWCVQGSAWPR